MSRHYYIGKSNSEVIPAYSRINATEHYAWCLNSAINALEHATTNADKLLILGKFRDDMNSSPAAKIMFAEYSGLFTYILLSNTSLSNEYIIDCLAGLPVGKQLNYISYIE